MQRGELASDRARDSETKSLILDAMSQHCNSNDRAATGDSNGELTTESRLQTMRTEISSAAVEHRNLVARMTSSANNNSNNAGDTRSDTDTDSSSETRSLSSSTE